MKKRVLVLNRGEIACRVFRAVKEMGLDPVGVYTPEDRDGWHTQQGGLFFEVPSYLDEDALLEVAQKAQAHWIHPGYGFLSEKASFVKKVETNKLRWLGPTASSMELLGAKIQAKKLADQVSVPTLPWVEVGNLKTLKQKAQALGFPVLLKATAGGGGKGMRKVSSLSELEQAAQGATLEAKNAFGNGTLLIEKYLSQARHIEIQIFGDGKGKVIALYERDCSAQRRHQKVLEEAPALGISSRLRKALCDAAKRLASHVRYRSAGTVEFLVEPSEKFYFLEMNTRLQVEHPVTEAVTGIDLVKLQLKEALLGDRFQLPAVPTLRGHAIEARIYAEDPTQGFVPTPGKVVFLKWPLGGSVRVESGVGPGQEVSLSFDPMLGKLIVWGQNRKEALSRLKQALCETVFLGVGTNLNYLRALLEHPRVQAGSVYTHFLEKEFQDVFLKKNTGLSGVEKKILLFFLQTKIASHTQETTEVSEPKFSCWERYQKSFPVWKSKDCSK